MARNTDWQSRIGRRLTLRDLHILSTVVRWGSMAKAASNLAMSQSAVSESIAHLEDAMRVRLLDRAPQGIKPTIYAEALLKRSHTVFDELQQAVKDIEFLADPTLGELRIGSAEFLSAWLIPTAIDRLSSRYPQITVRVLPADTTTLEFREVRDRVVDLTVGRVPKDFSHNDLSVESLFEDPHSVVTGTASSWARRSKISLAELVDEPWITFPSPLADAFLAETFGAEGLKPPSGRISANSVVLRFQLLATGRFLAIIANSVLQAAKQQWPIKVLPIKLKEKVEPIAVISLKNRTLSPVAKLFMEELRAVSNKLPPESRGRK